MAKGKAGLKNQILFTTELWDCLTALLGTLILPVYMSNLGLNIPKLTIIINQSDLGNPSRLETNSYYLCIYCNCRSSNEALIIHLALPIISYYRIVLPHSNSLQLMELLCDFTDSCCVHIITNVISLLK